MVHVSNLLVRLRRDGPGAFGQGGEVGHDLLVRRGVRRFGRHDRMPPLLREEPLLGAAEAGVLREPRRPVHRAGRSLLVLASNGVRVGVGGFAAVVPLWIVMLARALREVLPDDTHGVASRGKRASPPGFVRSEDGITPVVVSTNGPDRTSLPCKLCTDHSNRRESHSV